jgi:type IV pilus assembly protein PilY1
MTNWIRKTLLVLTLLANGLMCLWATSAKAEDIDLFVSATTASNDLPNVLIVLDNTANWNTAFTNEIAALSSVINGLTVDKFRVGIMMFTETGSGNSGDDGGYVRAAIRTMNASNKTKLQNLVNSFDKVGDKSNGGKAGKTMVDVYRYFAGAAPLAGNNKAKTDYTGNTSGTTASVAIYATTASTTITSTTAFNGNALNSKAATAYNSPVTSAGCAKNYVIYISNGPAQDNASDSSTSNSALSAAGGSTSVLPISPTGSQSNTADEWARFMKQSSLGITTYTVDVDPGTTGQGPGWTALMKSMASVSSGRYFAVSSSGGSTEISTALNKIFSEIQSVNTVFASVSLPVSVNTQGSYLNQVFVGMFRPDQDAFPRWNGNLKQYKLAEDGADLKLVDADGSYAVNASTGFITECARSFWTPTSVDTYWATKPNGACLAVASSSASNYPDGNVVEKGGQAYLLRQAAPSTRTVKTCSASACTSLLDFNTSNVSSTELGVSTSADQTNLISWAKGTDLDDENIDSVTTAMRMSAHGDVVHSRPAAVNYGTDAAPKVVVFYGANDGLLRAVNGNRSTAHNSVSAGAEFWAFVPPEFHSNFSRLRANTSQISFYGSTASGTAPKPYAMDGAMTVYQSGSTVRLYAGMRRGGRTIYGFNVDNPTSPSLLWRIGCPNASNDTGCSTGMTGIGQTWSAAKVASAYGYSTGPLLIFGGGYDACEDADPRSCTSSAKGRAIYVVDAGTGAVQQSFTTDGSVPADVVLVTDNAGKLSYIYAADSIGNVYRINAKTGAPSTWALTKVASLGCSTTATCTSPRKFLSTPDVVSDGTYMYVLIGSGDREKPVAGYTNAASVSNRFFMFKDKPDDTSWLASESATCGSNLVCLSSLASIPQSGTVASATVSAKKGWNLAMRTSEQVVTSSITVYNTTTFSTHVPHSSAAGVCGSTLGTTRVYNVNYANAGESSSRDAQLAGGGLPPSPVAGKVILDSGVSKVFVIGAKATSALDATARTPGSSGNTQPKGRVYWYSAKQ